MPDCATISHEPFLQRKRFPRMLSDISFGAIARNSPAETIVYLGTFNAFCQSANDFAPTFVIISLCRLPFLVTAAIRESLLGFLQAVSTGKPCFSRNE